MKEKIILILAVLVLGAIVAIGSQPMKGEIPVMLSSELKAIQDKKEKVVLLDVREKNEFDEEHIEGAIHLPKSKFDKKDPQTEQVLSKIGKNTPIVTYCGSGHRSGWVAKELQKRGFRNVQNLDGISYWKKQYATIKGPKEKNIEPIRVKTEEAKYNYDNFKDIVWLDVRDTEEYKAGHIKGAIHINLTELESKANELPKDREIFLYCSGTYGGGTCSASLSGARILINNGFSYGKIKVYEEGFDTWREMGLPVEK